MAEAPDFTGGSTTARVTGEGTFSEVLKAQSIKPLGIAVRCGRLWNRLGQVALPFCLANQ